MHLSARQRSLLLQLLVVPILLVATLLGGR